MKVPTYVSKAIIFQMFDFPPKSWGKLRQVEKEHFQYLIDVLKPLLPQSRQIYESLQLQ